MRTTKVACDRCGRDLTATANVADYRVLLCSEPIPPDPGPGTTTCVHVEPDFPAAMHFCDRRCLVHHLVAKFPWAVPKAGKTPINSPPPV